MALYPYDVGVVTLYLQQARKSGTVPCAVDGSMRVDRRLLLDGYSAHVIYRGCNAVPDGSKGARRAAAFECRVCPCDSEA